MFYAHPCRAGKQRSMLVRVVARDNPRMGRSSASNMTTINCLTAPRSSAPHHVDCPGWGIFSGRW